MSTIVKTDNYELITYGDVKYPLFLKDISDNMTIIDSLIKDIADDIEDINRVIDTVSTQNIDDLIARILALEVKVDNNATAINSLLSSVSGLASEIGKNTGRINDINAQLVTMKADIDNLKQCCDNVLSTLVDHGNRISANETAITNINTEIERIKADVIGNAQDIQTLATQIASIIEAKQDKLIAGTGIEIVDNVISTTGTGVLGTYEDGNLTIG